MKVKPNQNLAIPMQSDANVVDGTSNTIMFGESSKAEKPFAKDKFESFKFEMGSLPCNLLEGSSKEPPAAGVESPKDQLSGLVKDQDKKSFMDYTDDSCE